MDFPAHELKKHFKIGDHVKVIAGRYEGDTGLVVRVEENMAVLFSDLTMHEVKQEPTFQELTSHSDPILWRSQSQQSYEDSPLSGITDQITTD